MRKNALTLILIPAMFLIIYFLNTWGFFESLEYALLDKSDLVLNFSGITDNADTISAEISNQIVLRVQVLTQEGDPVSHARVSFSSMGIKGTIMPGKVITGKDGIGYAIYIPCNIDGTHTQDFLEENGELSTYITASIPKTNIMSAIKYNVIHPPVILLHGFLATSSYMENLKDYLEERGFWVYSIDFDSTQPVEISSGYVSKYISDYKKKLLDSGIIANKFSVVAHSMGGTLIRYFTCSQSYLEADNISKIIFVAVPHKGSPWATLGANYFNNAGIREMMPADPLYTEVFPSLINQGLNPHIQTANIAVDNDEVVPTESSSLQAWNISTEFFNVGKSTLTMEKIVSGDLLQSSNHKKVLNNVKVFRRIIELLVSDLPYPAKIQ